MPSMSLRRTLCAAVPCLAAAAAMAAGPVHAEDAGGYWRGRIANALDVFVQFQKGPDGHWAGTLTVPQQGMVSKVDKLAVTGDQVSFAMTALDAGFTARWNDADKAWNGTWRQQGRSVPLVLRRTDAGSLKPSRPQEEAIAARAPGYTGSEVRFANDAANVTLAGTFTVPHGKGPFPAVVLVHGSGPLDRDQKVFEHKIFLVLADHLSRQGIAVLRYDKRGIGKSSGVYAGATSLDFASDAEAAVRFLRGRPEVATRHIGIVGHSEGGLIAPLVASRDAGLGFLVLLAGPGVRGELLMAEQLALAASANGAPEHVVEKERVLNQAILAAMASEPQLEAARARAKLVVEEARRNGTLSADAEARVGLFSTPWFHTFLRHEPGPALRATRQPVLVLNGELDRQVPAAMDLDAIRTALKDNPRAVVKALPKLNHLFQTAVTGAGSEYFGIDETIAPAALDIVSDWIRATAR
ncbi:alpha/beta fold hydrolase [Massilia dura]|uniref:Alpha/beta fold hydrolase n=2 Tax=Pseudoduganella dura TaxID=321982 RepID=A0A6I3X581_9BURK|nr:alpha/beta fold hydrolase [Pseudoduganella dura]